jgi:hypothetical protein
MSSAQHTLCHSGNAQLQVSSLLLPCEPTGVIHPSILSSSQLWASPSGQLPQPGGVLRLHGGPPTASGVQLLIQVALQSGAECTAFKPSAHMYFCMVCPDDNSAGIDALHSNHLRMCFCMVCPDDNSGGAPARRSAVHHAMLQVDPHSYSRDCGSQETGYYVYECGFTSNMYPRSAVKP